MLTLILITYKYKNTTLYVGDPSLCLILTSSHCLQTKLFKMIFFNYLHTTQPFETTVPPWAGNRENKVDLKVSYSKSLLLYLEHLVPLLKLDINILSILHYFGSPLGFCTLIFDLMRNLYSYNACIYIHSILSITM